MYSRFKEGSVLRNATFGACFFCAFAVAASSKPAGADASSRLADVLARYRSAVGAGATSPDRYVLSGTLAGEGLSGTFQTRVDGDRERDDRQLGPRSESEWFLGDTAYARDQNGDVRKLRGLLLRRAKTERLIDSNGFLDAPTTIRSLARRTIDGRAADVLEIAAPGGEPESLALDAASGVPIQIAYDDDDGRTTVALSDWRTLKGARFPFRSVVSNGDIAYDVTESTTAAVIGGPADPNAFAIPPSRTLEANAAQTVPLVERDGHFYVKVRVGGAPYSFLLDSGAANVLLDERVARAAGLHEEGALEASGASRTGGLHAARLDDLQIGDGHLRNLVVSTIDLGSTTGGSFRIDGVLGYPFFSSAIVRLDPVAGTLTFAPPGKLAPAGVRVDVELDRLLPQVAVRLNDRASGQMVVDTGNGGAVLLYRPFVDANPGIVPYSDVSRRSFGVGGSTVSYRSSLDALEIAGTTLYHLDTDVMLATQGAFADRFVAGNLGLAVLHNFVVTFDDPDSAIYFERSTVFDDGRSRGH